MAAGAWYDVSPSAARLSGSLRDIGYDFPTAVADVVDNSVAAGATRVEILVEYDGTDSRVFVADDGLGMSPSALLEALRFGTRRGYSRGELGRYGLGLKTASLSQCRLLTVVSRSSKAVVRTCARALDLDLIEEWDQWIIVDPSNADPAVARARQWLAEGTGTVVIWQLLDRVLPEKRPEGGWARRRLDALAVRTAEHLGMVFHRFIEGTAARPQLVITVNGQKVTPWDPFASQEPATVELPPQRFEIESAGSVGKVALRRFVLPSRDRFKDPAGFDRLSGPLNWNRQQGLYVYRADRLVQWGGWGGIRGIDEHTKLARAAVEFDTDLDAAFNINVAKMRVTLPAQLRQFIEPSVNELCVLADDAYRKTSRGKSSSVPADLGAPAEVRAVSQAAANAGLALRMAAMQVDQWSAWEQIEAVVRRQSPEVAELLGLGAV
ncbi:histidine kinase/DNA gyrase B/HSP90-like ATPase [Krasilnikovia cinnamomea]|uniref:Histidine kinase/DNA gyrase B/HSP90-like ATPase n=1 Tax=Krasilnikovia cinnamomea TaxID=349313 RepID=A0A4Q7ZLU1_9ACTN|nr:histidine kinase/DNA gyrase B/HSP90-like ATPase [Krasilnikovia cinnamomea]